MPARAIGPNLVISIANLPLRGRHSTRHRELVAQALVHFVREVDLDGAEHTRLPLTPQREPVP
jgi:hypothetical protein